jgi:hypothetical protein
LTKLAQKSIFIITALLLGALFLVNNFAFFKYLTGGCGIFALPWFKLFYVWSWRCHFAGIFMSQFGNIWVRSQGKFFHIHINIFELGSFNKA